MTVLPKKILTIVLLLIVAVPLFFSAAFIIKQKHVQYQMREKLEQASLQTITVPSTEIIWVKKDKEVIINGKLFDVKSISIAGNNTTIKGLFDDVEERLLAKLKDAINLKKETGNHVAGQVSCIFLPLYSETVSFHIQCDWKTVSTDFPTYSTLIPEVYTSSTAPPPKNS